MKRSDYKSTTPLDEHEVLEELKRIHQKKAGHEAELVGRKEAYDKTKEAIALCDQQINDILRATNEDRFAYRLKSGDVTLAPPDSQLDIEDAMAGDGAGGKKKK